MRGNPVCYVAECVIGITTRANVLLTVAGVLKEASQTSDSSPGHGVSGATRTSDTRSVYV